MNRTRKPSAGSSGSIMFGTFYLSFHLPHWGQLGKPVKEAFYGYCRWAPTDIPRPNPSSYCTGNENRKFSCQQAPHSYSLANDLTAGVCVCGGRGLTLLSPPPGRASLWGKQMRRRGRRFDLNSFACRGRAPPPGRKKKHLTVRRTSEHMAVAFWTKKSGSADR